MKIIIDVTKMFKDGNVPETCRHCPFKQHYEGADEWGEYTVYDECCCELIALGCYGNREISSDIDNEDSKLDDCPLKAVE